jgi:RNA polymerase sigma-70 factor (ECF subfamily)
MTAAKPSVEQREAELIRRVCEGEKEAFYELVRPYERVLFTAAMAILNNPADAEEVTQEAVLKGLAALPRFRGEAKFSTWLVQITINETRLKRRKDRRHLYESLDEPYADDEGDYRPKDLADWRKIPLEALQRKELQEAFEPWIRSNQSTGRCFC